MLQFGWDNESAGGLGGCAHLNMAALSHLPVVAHGCMMSEQFSYVRAFHLPSRPRCKATLPTLGCCCRQFRRPGCVTWDVAPGAGAASASADSNLP
jgi:hypothetical protein